MLVTEAKQAGLSLTKGIALQHLLIYKPSVQVSYKSKRKSKQNEEIYIRETYGSASSSLNKIPVVQNKMDPLCLGILLQKEVKLDPI